MSKPKNYWTVKRLEGWVVKCEGAVQIASMHSTQQEAWSEARRLARGAEGAAFLRGGDGKVHTLNMYGKNLFPAKG